MELKNLRVLRKQKGLSQSEAAEIFNVSLKSYNAWEMGDYQPKIETLIAMANYFHTRIDYIVGRETSDLTPEEKKILNMAADIIKEKMK